jgi:tetratricopeptide (TPR) repeat protein
MEAFPFPAEEDKTDLMGSVYSQMADTYLALKQPELSIFYAGKAIDLDNRKPAFYTIRCGAYLQKGKYPKALADCNKALAGSPDERAAGYKALLDRLMPVQ